ncbi:MAG: IS30 family transposase [Gemmatimonadaceae bacterium]|nr:IS30 family transposase [Gemmatimonadaceae bacterium]
MMETLTWERGLEMAHHRRFTVSTDVAVYFGDPQGPWQRGTNENTNGLLRQYLPKDTDLAAVTQAQLNAIARHLNARPRKTLSFMTPAEKLLKLLLRAVEPAATCSANARSCGSLAFSRRRRRYSCCGVSPAWSSPGRPNCFSHWRSRFARTSSSWATWAKPTPASRRACTSWTTSCVSAEPNAR